MDALSALAKAQAAAERLKIILNKDDVAPLDALIEAETWDPKGFFFATSSYPLDWAAAAGAVKCLKRLLPLRDQQPGAVDQALVEAVRESQVACVRSLLEAGAAAEGVPGQYVEDTEEDSPISAALNVLHPEIVSMLCNAGGVARSDVGWLNMGLRMAFASRKKTKVPCLLLVATEIAKRIERQADFSLAFEVMKKLADWLKKTAKRAENGEPYARLEAAVRSRFDAEGALKKEITDFLALSGHGREPKDLAWLRGVFLDQPPAIRQRLASAALPYLVGEADDHGWWDIVFEAIEVWGGDINARCEGGMTLLMWAFLTSDNPDIEKIERLLKGQSDVNSVNEEGYTALALVLMGMPHRKDLVALLRSNGAKTYEEMGLPYPRSSDDEFKREFAKLPPLPDKTVAP